MTKIEVTQIIRCPLLDSNGLCTIYENRPSCCRNYPNKTEGMFCNDNKCIYDEQGNLDCFNCKDKCCNYLRMDTFDLDKMNISCEECKEVYCNDE